MMSEISSKRRHTNCSYENRQKTRINTRKYEEAYCDRENIRVNIYIYIYTVKALLTDISHERTFLLNGHFCGDQPDTYDFLETPSSLKRSPCRTDADTVRHSVIGKKLSYADMTLS